MHSDYVHFGYSVCAFFVSLILAVARITLLPLHKTEKLESGGDDKHEKIIIRIIFY